ncbi:hypothetical protein CEXT_31971 [Caerostris extrusa]|uniref:Uncharacterized protein n=1 Tax=Caerostris extrusa TaxID=172846 RepID=A0AAV4RYZ3_CAEEX|nr:hypothetical protein CEXT_31971 [Caerostris extrusa]
MDTNHASLQDISMCKKQAMLLFIVCITMMYKGNINTILANISLGFGETTIKGAKNAINRGICFWGYLLLVVSAPALAMFLLPKAAGLIWVDVLGIHCSGFLAIRNHWPRLESYNAKSKLFS